MKWLKYLLFLIPATVLAANVHLQWNANSEPDLAGYEICEGYASRDYETCTDVGNVTDYIREGTALNQTYYWAVIAYDFSGNESDYSDEVVWSESSPQYIGATNLRATKRHEDQQIMAISLDNYDSVKGNNDTVLTISNFAVSADDNGVLVVTTSAEDSALFAVSSVVWNGDESFSPVRAVNHQFGYNHAEIWVLESPTATTADVVVTFAGEENSPAVGVFSLHGVSVEGSIPQNDTSETTTTNITTTVNVTTAGSLIIDVVSCGDETTGTADETDTKDLEEDVNSTSTYISGHTLASSTGNKTVGYDLSPSANRALIVAAAFAPAAAGTTVTLTKGTLAFTGKDVSQNDATSLASVALSLTGKDLSAVSGFLLGSTALTLTGKDVSLADAPTLSTGTLTLTGKSLDPRETLTLAVQSLSLTGKAVFLAITVLLTALSLALTGKAVFQNETFKLEKATLTLTGKDLAVSIGAVIVTLVKGTLTFTGKVLFLNEAVNLVKGALVFGGKAVTAAGGLIRRGLIRAGIGIHVD